MNDPGLGVVVSMKDAFSRNAYRIQSSMQSLDATVAGASERMTHNGNLYVGGDFTYVGDLTVNYVAKWNGSTWSALGGGMNDVVVVLVMIGGELYAGGLSRQRAG